MSLMKTIMKIFFAAYFILFSAGLFARSYPDNAYEKIPDDGYKIVENEGKVIRYFYEIPGRKIEGQEQKYFKKSALVYLPAGFDENDPTEKYNVLYLMHGGGQSSEVYFNGENASSLLKKLLDNMHDRGMIKNTIVCAPTFNAPQKSGLSANSGSFYLELTRQLMPQFEKEFHVIKDRDHRAFGGFSMGAMVTWNVFEHCLADISGFIPVSGNCWTLGNNSLVCEQTAKYLARVVELQGYGPDDFKIYAGCGEHEIASATMIPQIEEMKKLTDTFKYTENFATGNLYFLIYKDSGHDMVSVMRTIYNGLPKMFKD